MRLPVDDNKGEFVAADIFRTGRTRRLTLTFDYEMLGLYREIFPVGPGFIAQTGMAVHWMGFELWGGALNDVCGQIPTGAPGSGFLPPPAGGPSGIVYVFQLKLPADLGVGWGNFYNQYGPWGSPGHQYPVAAYQEMPDATPTDFSAKGSVTLYMDVEEWKQISVDLATPRVLLDYPTSGAGPADDDFVGLSTLGYFEGPKAGGEYGFSIAMTNGNGASFSGSIPAGLSGAEPEAHRSIARILMAPSGDDPIAAKIKTMKLNGDPIDFDLLQYSSSPVAVSGTSGGTINFDVDPTTVLGPYQARCDCTPDTAIHIDGLTTRLFEQNYGASVDVRRSWADTPLLSCANGVYSGTESYKDESVSVQLCDSIGPIVLQSALVQKPDLFVWLDNAWMVANGEMPQDWRILIADDFSWAPFSLMHRSTSLIDDFNSTAGWSGANVTLSVASGAMVTKVSGGAGSVTKNYSEDASQYRRLRLRARGSGSSTIRVRINGSGLYSWNVAVGPIYQEIVIDLCAPGGSSALYDLTDNSYVAPGDFYGPQQIASIAFEDLQNGQTYYFDRIEFIRSGSATYTPLPPFDESYVGDDGIRRYRVCWGLADRRQVFDMPYRKDDTFVSVAALISEIQSHDAYDMRITAVASPASDATNYYFNHSARPAAFMATETYQGGIRRSRVDTPMGGVVLRAVAAAIRQSGDLPRYRKSRGQLWGGLSVAIYQTVGNDGAWPCARQFRSPRGGRSIRRFEAGERGPADGDCRFGRLLSLRPVQNIGGFLEGCVRDERRRHAFIRTDGQKVPMGGAGKQHGLGRRPNSHRRRQDRTPLHRECG